MTDMDASPQRRFSSRDVLMVSVGVLLAVLGALVWTWTRSDDTQPETEDTSVAAHASSSNELTVSNDVLTAAAIVVVPVMTGPSVERVYATGVVEPNQLRAQQVTPLVAGRIERVHVALGDHVRTGAVLLTLSSPQVAELGGNLRAAEAKLTQADATLARTKRLVDLGAGAGKDLVAAEAEQRTAHAQVEQLRQSLRALGAQVEEGAAPSPAPSVIAVRAPLAGAVTQRSVNPGEWIEAGKSLVMLADLATVWVIVSVPEARLSVVRRGMPVEIRLPTAAQHTTGRVSYVDPQLDPETRTARVRVEVPNPGEALKIGMFVEVSMEAAVETPATEVRVPSEALQRIGERTVVFVPRPEAGHFEVRDVDVGDEVQGTRVVRAGLRPGERVVAKGGFTLKSQLLKGQFGEEEEISGKAR